MAKNKVKEKSTAKKKVRVPTEKKWFLINAESKILGRLATKIAVILMGKNKTTWQPNLDNGDYVIVINASKVVVTGKKEEQKKYYQYSGYPGGLKVESLRSVREKKPGKLIYHSVAGMLPKNKLGKAMIKKFFIYSGGEHPHEAQKITELKG